MPDPNQISDIVDVTILLDVSAVGAAGFGVPMVAAEFTAPGGWVGVARAKLYAGSPEGILSSMAADGFATDSESYGQVTALMTQSPPPSSVVVGRLDAGDADITAGLDAIRAENADWYPFSITSRAAGVIQLAFAWAQPRFVFFSSFSKDADPLNDVGNHIFKTLNTLGYSRGHIMWHDPATASGYGPAVAVTSAPQMFALADGDELLVTVDGSLNTIPLAATAASDTTGAEPFAVNIGDDLVLDVNNAGNVTVTWTADDITDGAATASQVAARLEQVPGLVTEVTAGTVVISTLQKGTGAEIEVVSGTSAAALGLVVGVEVGTSTGSFIADVANTTAAEAADWINDGLTGGTAATQGLKLAISTTSQGLADAELEIGGSANVALGFPEQSLGTGVSEDYADAAFMGDIFTTDFDQFAITADNRTLLGIAPDTLTGTQRANIRKYYGSTYEQRAGRNEVHFGHTPSGIYVDERIAADLTDARLTEDIKQTLNQAAAVKSKIPYTDAGIAVMEGTIRARLSRLDTAGWITYDPTEISGLGDTGVTVPTLAQQLPVDVAARRLRGFAFRQRLQGAVHKVNVVGTLTSF